jgi:hypothetical protein
MGATQRGCISIALDVQHATLYHALSALSFLAWRYWRTRTPTIDSAVGSWQVPTGGSEWRSPGPWCRSPFCAPSMGPIVGGSREQGGEDIL